MFSLDILSHRMSVMAMLAGFSQGLLLALHVPNRGFTGQNLFDDAYHCVIPTDFPRAAHSLPNRPALLDNDSPFTLILAATQVSAVKSRRGNYNFVTRD